MIVKRKGKEPELLRLQSGVGVRAAMAAQNALEGKGPLTAWSNPHRSRQVPAWQELWPKKTSHPHAVSGLSPQPLSTVPSFQSGPASRPQSIHPATFICFPSPQHTLPCPAFADVEYAEPNYIVRAAVFPNDPGYSRQWHLPRISAEAAWETSTGSFGVRVCVVDTGIDYT